MRTLRYWRISSGTVTSIKVNQLPQKATTTSTTTSTVLAVSCEPSYNAQDSYWLQIWTSLWICRGVQLYLMLLRSWSISKDIFWQNKNRQHNVVDKIWRQRNNLRGKHLFCQFGLSRSMKSTRNGWWADSLLSIVSKVLCIQCWRRLTVDIYLAWDLCVPLESVMFWIQVMTLSSCSNLWPLLDWFSLFTPRYSPISHGL